jgi:uncharacterized membrane protein
MDTSLKMPWSVRLAYAFVGTCTLAVLIAFHWWLIVSCWQVLAMLYGVVLFCASMTAISKWDREVAFQRYLEAIRRNSP